MVPLILSVAMSKREQNWKANQNRLTYVFVYHGNADLRQKQKIVFPGFKSLGSSGTEATPN